MNSIVDDIKTNPLIIAGPCSVESKEMIFRIAAELKNLGITYLRGGAFKPRTSPKSFQGLGYDGIRLLRDAADKYGLNLVSEIMDAEQFDNCKEFIDVYQIGSRNMSSYSLLKYIGKETAQDNKPVLLKRGFSATLKELTLASEYITDKGNPNVILCLRGIRTFEQIDSVLRFTPDLASIPELKERTSLPVFFDPSHSTGNSKFVIPISKAAIVLGVDGLLIECHNKPDCALCDGRQALYPSEICDIISFINKRKSENE